MPLQSAQIKLSVTAQDQDQDQDKACAGTKFAPVSATRMAPSIKHLQGNSDGYQHPT